MSSPLPDYLALAGRIRALAQAAGFQRVGISGVELQDDEAFLQSWLDEGLHGTMAWMAHHGDKRSRPAELIPGTLRVVSVGMDYGKDGDAAWDNLRDAERAYVARYALGRDYHKLMRNRLQKLADEVAKEIGQKTKGRIEIKVFPGNQLGDYTLVYEELIRGTIDMSLTSVPSQFDPRLELMYINGYVKFVRL